MMFSLAVSTYHALVVHDPDHFDQLYRFVMEVTVFSAHFQINVKTTASPRVTCEWNGGP